MDRFIITAQTDGCEKEYYGIDQASGGYPYWGCSITDAKIFPSRENAIENLDSSEFTRKLEFTDGSSGPPRMIWSGAKLNIDKQKGFVTIKIEKIVLEDVFSLEYFGELKDK